MHINERDLVSNRYKFSSNEFFLPLICRVLLLTYGSLRIYHILPGCYISQNTILQWSIDNINLTFIYFLYYFLYRSKYRARWSAIAVMWYSSMTASSGAALASPAEQILAKFISNFVSTKEGKEAYSTAGFPHNLNEYTVIYQICEMEM